MIKGNEITRFHCTQKSDAVQINLTKGRISYINYCLKALRPEVVSHMYQDY